MNLDILIENANSFKISKILQVSASLGIFEALSERSLSVNELANELALRHVPLTSLMNALVSIGIIMPQDHQKFAIASHLSNALSMTSATSIINYLCWMDWQYDAWSGLGKILKIDDNQKSWIDSCQSERDTWISSLDEIARYHQYPKQLVNSLNLSDANTLLDVGGGSGIYSIELCKKYSSLSSIIFEKSETARITRKFISSSGLHERISVVEGDFRHDIFPKDMDVVLMSNIFHGNSEETIISLCEKAFECLGENGFLIVHGFFLKNSPDAIESVLLSMTMHLNGGGKNYAVDDIIRLLRLCHFDIEIHQTLPNIFAGDVLIGRKVSDHLQREGNYA